MNDDSIYPFRVLGVGGKWYVCKPNGEQIDLYFNRVKHAFKVAETLKAVYFDD